MTGQQALTLQQIDQAIIANRPGEPFVYRGDGTSMDGMDWQAGTVPPTWTEVSAWATAIATAQQQRALGSAWVQLRMIRDRWLAQTDYIESYINSDTTFSHLPQPIKDAIAANSAAWVTWRQQLRDLPATSGLDPVGTVSAVPHASSQTPWPSQWPQPPVAPVIYFT